MFNGGLKSLLISGLEWLFNISLPFGVEDEEPVLNEPESDEDNLD